jgi:hypothetical protein
MVIEIGSRFTHRKSLLSNVKIIKYASVRNCLRTLNPRRENIPLMPDHTFPPRILPRSQIIWNINAVFDDLKERMNDDQKRANEIAQMRGAFNWQTYYH